MRTATVYNFLLEANLMASIAILLMLPVRRFLRGRLGNRAIYFAWLLVAIRLLCPLSLPNPAINAIRPDFTWDLAIRPIASQLQIRFSDASQSLYRWAGDHASQNTALVNGLDRLVDSTFNGMLSLWLMQLYALGAAVVLGWFVIGNIRFRRKLLAGRIEPISGELLAQYQAMCAQRGVKPLPVYFTDPLPSACLVGVVHPYIALPLTAAPAQAIQVLTHEVCHYRSRDHLWAVLRLACCVLHWFNPLVWLAANASRTDCELACDERVVASLNDEQKLAYANVLVLAASRRNAPGVAVLATGMTMTGRKLKTRVRSILHQEHIRRGFALAFVLLACMALVGVFATSEYRTIPAIPTGGNALRLPAGGIQTQAQAIDHAKQIWSNRFVQTDVSNAEWTVTQTNGRYQVDATVTGASAPLSVTFLQDGRVLALDNPSSGLADSQSSRVLLFYRQATPETDVTAYATRFMDAFGEGLSADIASFEYHEETEYNNRHFVSFTGMNAQGRPACEVVVQVLPEVCVVFYQNESQLFPPSQLGSNG